MNDFKIPDSIDTNNPKEAISYCIAYGMEEGILPKDFKMSSEGYDILEAAITNIWDRDTEVINEIMIAFVAGYATGSKQVSYRG